MLDFLRGRPSFDDLVDFLDHVAMLSKQGTVLAAVASYLPPNNKMKRFKQRLYFLMRQRQLTLAEALERLNVGLNPLEIMLIKNGETTGEIASSLEEVITNKKKVKEVQGQLLKSMRMPLITLLVAFGVLVFLSFYLMPKMEKLFIESLGSLNDLPRLAQLAFKVTRFVRENILFIIGGILGFPFVFYYFVNFPRLPLLRDVIRYQALFIMFVSLRFLTGAGVTPQTAMARISYALRGRVFEDLKKAITATLKRASRESTTLSNAMSRTPFFGKEVSVFIHLAEQTGNYPEVAELALEKFRRKFFRSLDRLSMVLNPAVFIFTVVLVGGLLVSLYSTMFSLSSTIK